MSRLDVTQFNDNVPGLKTFQDERGDIRTTVTLADQGEPFIDINYSNMARRVLAAFGLEESPVEKYAVEDVKDLQRKELTQVQAEINTIEANPTGMTKEASSRLDELRGRQIDLSAALAQG